MPPTEVQKATASRLLGRLTANSTFLGSMPSRVKACTSEDEMTKLIRELQQEVYNLDVRPGNETVCGQWVRG